MAITLHDSVPLHCVILPDKEVWTGQKEGLLADIIAEAANWVVGTVLAQPPRASICGEGRVQGAIVSACQVTRKEGGIANLDYGFTYVRKVEAWTCDMSEISKDIKTWLSSERGGYTEQEAAGLLAQIAQWEAFKDAGDYIKWQNFVCDEKGTVLTGDALLLAHKIMKGVSCYTIYAPVITRTSLWISVPPLVHYGYIDTPVQREGWEVLGGDVSVDTSLQWLKTGARAQPNGDGTYTLVEQWTGADEIDGDLYPTVSTGDTGDTEDTEA